MLVDTSCICTVGPPPPLSQTPHDSVVGVPGNLSCMRYLSFGVQARLHPPAGHLVHAGGALRQNHS